MSLRNLFTAAAVLAPSDPSRPSADRSFDFVCSTPTADGYGRVVVQDWDLSRYEKNPVVLWNHGDGGSFFGAGDVDATLPIGFASNVRVEGGELRATISIVTAEANPIAEKVYQGLRQGSISAVSVGWTAGDATYDKESGALLLSKNELLEISIVAIPANPDAVKAAALDAAAANGRLAASMLGDGARRAPAPHVQRTPEVARLAAAVEGATWRGKRFAELSLEERIDLSEEDRERYYAMRDGRPLAAGKTEGERAIEVLLAATGAPNVDAAIVALPGIVDKAARFDGELAAARSELAANKRARVDELITATIKAGRLTPAMKPMVLRAAGAKDHRTAQLDKWGDPIIEWNYAGLDLEELEKTLARMPQMFNVEHAQTGAPEHANMKWRGKGYHELTFEERHDLATEDYDLFRALKAAADSDTTHP